MGETVDVELCFRDPNGEALDFEAFSSDTGVATVQVRGSMLTVTAVSPGTAVVTVVATDPTGLEARQSFQVVVPNRPPDSTMSRLQWRPSTLTEAAGVMPRRVNARCGADRVNVSLADSYAQPSPSLAADVAEGARVLDLSGDVLPWPVNVIDEEGNVVRVIGGEATLRDGNDPVTRMIPRENR